MAVNSADKPSAQPESETSQTEESPAQKQVTVLATDIRLDYHLHMASEQSSRRVFSSRGERTIVRALKGVTLAARQGEFIGLVGRNGSGKSTLLRVLAGVETPTSGNVWASSVPQLMGVGAALIPSLSGIDNIRIGLLAMGLEPAEVEAKMDSVIDLASLGDSVRLPMRTYSSGMSARLRFSIAVAADPEILMIDEALATGDSAFRERSNEAMKDLIRRSGTGFLVNHSSGAIRQLCNRVIWLDRGEIVQDGPTGPVMQAYTLFMNTLKKEGEDATLRMREKLRTSFTVRTNYLEETSLVEDSER